MKIEQEKTNTIKKTNYFHKKYRNPTIKKLMLSSYYNKYLSKEKLKENILEKKLSISSINYKVPNFYNENSLNSQLNFLRKLSVENNKESKLTKKISLFKENKTLPKLKRNKTENFDKKIKLEKRKSIINEFKKLTYKRNTFFHYRTNTETNLSNESFNKNEISSEKLYKIIFKSQIGVHKDLKPIIENKYNMKYAENEEQYNLIIEKEYQKNLSEGKRIKSKNVSPSIKLKLDDAQTKVKFMKDVIDYSYPLFVLSKIKIKQKNLRELKKQRTKKSLDYINEKDRRLKEVKIINDNRTKYLLKSFSFLK